MVVLLTYRSNDMYWNEFMSNDTWYGVTLMFRLRYYWNNVMSNATYNVIVIVIDSIHGQRNPHQERGLAGMGNGCFAEFCCCVPLCPCELRYSSSKEISFHRFPEDKVAGRECRFKSRRDMPLL